MGANIGAASTILVDSLSDGAPVMDGACTLREAIANANTNTDSSEGDCVSGNGADIIAFADGGTITLTSALPALSDPQGIVINGDVDDDNVGDITIHGNYGPAALSVVTGAEAELNGLRVIYSRGSLGGGLANSGILTVTNSTFFGNSANYSGGGIYNAGQLTITNSAITDNYTDGVGGGICNEGTVTVTDSLISGNEALSGGGISSGVSMFLEIVGTTISNNGAEYSGGGIYHTGIGSVSNSTISGNTQNSFLSQSGGGGIANSGLLFIYDSTLSGNTAYSGSSIFNPNGTLMLGRSVVVVGDSSNSCFGTITDEGGNLQWPKGSCVGTSGDPLLGPLQDNGGPTPTMLPGFGSGAIDAVDCDPAVSVDQRGVSRPQGEACDIGAVEVLTDAIFADGFE